ncbi:MAG: nucleotidyltransferase family protein, partial [Clostridiales bacterium]|nr:nucleotidyltransferase family protein [Candidatus Blautia equi]
MKVVGIVAEYNPFHNGHAYQINYIKETLHADYIAAVMSGDFVQRGTPALFSKQDRAKMALTCGVDLVLELPVRVSTSSAEGFASGAVELLHNLGCVDQICFGSECGTIEPFLNIASILVNEPEEYKAVLSACLRQGKSFPEARSLALREYLSDDSLDEFLSAPNNILGIEYCKALLRLNSSIEPVTLTRSGHDYHDTELSENSHPSATAIRQIISTFASGDYTENELKSVLSGQVPSVLLDHVLKLIMENSYVPESDLDLLLHHKLLQAVYENTLEDYLDISPALANRIRNTINAYT